ncbi:hypothetical protein HH219_18205 [Pseudoalteromonas sp. NEC-BIFX-2020_015]|uniref:hypothetical protein n=1 Tax=Pseudoalteromonas sp. NEC-BIFX-2020_015 TaxID=2729544 RepID=UPI0014616403|nr:hypothetical protein [Pseudoalteromonas sp. NEC-BIFX-2020_015]NMR27445.1 hypothetical protein [Pseudoalteromonas sp. NEC-BIFX-2020_015]
MREISPVENMSADEFLQVAHPVQQDIVGVIRKEKRAGERKLPSTSLIDQSAVLDVNFRKELIDKIASLVDENLFGRSEMCQQFSMLLELSLNHLGVYAKTVSGKASYKNDFSWLHFWVITKDEIIDANTDSMEENPAVPEGLTPFPYWGVKDKLPADRKLKVKSNRKVLNDTDVTNIWWPELKLWLSQYKK